MAKIAYCHNFELWQKKVIYGLKKTYAHHPHPPNPQTTKPHLQQKIITKIPYEKTITLL